MGLLVAASKTINAHRARAGNRGVVEEQSQWSCTVSGREVACATAIAIPAYELYEVEIPVEVAEPAGTDHAALKPGKRARRRRAKPAKRFLPATLTRAVRVSEAPVAFGLEEGGYVITPEDGEGKTVTQAGAHPFQLTSTVDFNQILQEVQEPGEPTLLEPGAPALPRTSPSSCRRGCSAT